MVRLERWIIMEPCKCEELIPVEVCCALGHKVDGVDGHPYMDEETAENALAIARKEDKKRFATCQVVKVDFYVTEDRLQKMEQSPMRRKYFDPPQPLAWDVDGPYADFSYCYE